MELNESGRANGAAMRVTRNGVFAFTQSFISGRGIQIQDRQTAAQALRTGRIITLFGCGGDRDRTKRPKMGRAAVQHSDVVILTSDNPRTEDPAVILSEVELGVKEALAARSHVRYRIIADRRAAIEAAIGEAKAGDMVLIGGKGHEDYQIVGTTKHHFDDREVAREMIEARRS